MSDVAYHSELPLSSALCSADYSSVSRNKFRLTPSLTREGSRVSRFAQHLLQSKHIAPRVARPTRHIYLKPSLARGIMTIEYWNAKKRFCESIESTHPRFVLSKWIVFYIISMNIGKFSLGILFSYGEAPPENLLPNQRFGFETVPSCTVSTSDNHYDSALRCMRWHDGWVVKPSYDWQKKKKQSIIG